MGFDEASLQPTYQLRLGAPGKSAGLDIATRLQLPEPLLAHARSVLPRMQADFQDLLRELQRQVDANAQREAELGAAIEQSKQRQADLEKEAVKHEQQRQREWENKSEALVADFEARAQAMMDRLSETSESRKAADQAQRLISKTKREFREEAHQTMAPPPQTAKALPPSLPIVEGAQGSPQGRARNRHRPPPLEKRQPRSRSRLS